MEDIYKIIEFYNPKGFGYCFNINNERKYVFMFNRLENNKYIFEINRIQNTNIRLIDHKSMRNFICKTVYNFIMVDVERVVFIVYDNEDNLAKARIRLFEIWFKCYNKRKEFKKINIQTSTNEIISMIFNINNIKFIEEIGL